MNKETKEQKFGISTTTIVLITGTVLVFWLANFILPIIITLGDWSDRGILGDMFGISNSLFSGLAFAGVIIAILLQMKELSLQRKELVQTRKEIAGQREQLEGQRSQMEIQNLENRFFQLLALLNDSVQQLRTGTGQAGSRGFESYVAKVKIYYSEIKKAKEELGEMEIVREAFHLEYQQLDQSVISYARILFSIFKLISQMTNKEMHQQFYANIVIALLSHPELLFMFYECIYTRNSEFQSLIEEYGVFRNIDRNQLIDLSHEYIYYKEGAYKNSN